MNARLARAAKIAKNLSLELERVGEPLLATQAKILYHQLVEKAKQRKEKTMKQT